MAAGIKTQDEKTMASDAIIPAPDSGDLQPPRTRAASAADSGGYFTIHKKGQGYWTRICTAAAAALILLLTVSFVYEQLPPWLTPAITPANPTHDQTVHAVLMTQRITLAVCAGLTLAMALILWRLMNKTANVEFLIATDMEMKKVNWTSREELIGSTKVVIIFMFVIAIVLFVVDLLFGYLFYFLTVLKSKPL